MRTTITILAAFFIFTQAQAQFGYGITANTEIYQRYNNPEDGLAGTSAGSFLFNLGVGPKIWMGGNNLSLSLETTANWGIFGLDVNDYKGLGMVSFPMLAHLNFGGLSGLDKEGKFGFTVGGGIQYNKTELYYLNGGDKEIGVTRDFFKTYVGEIGYGFGMSGFTLHAYVRYGYNPDNSANSFNFGIRYDFNLPKLKQISDPESDL
ncbi:MAG: hypothetical protein HKN68_05220 [Saprospiraceae bacterium]|nr:hypothetical protein [Saprospiraceae bacterium]